MPSDRERLAVSFRDWVHGSALSQCGRGVDTCPDWDLAYELADAALSAAATARPDWEELAWKFKEQRHAQAERADKAEGIARELYEALNAQTRVKCSEEFAAMCPTCAALKSFERASLGEGSGKAEPS